MLVKSPVRIVIFVVPHVAFKRQRLGKAKSSAKMGRLEVVCLEICGGPTSLGRAVSGHP